MTTLLTQRSEEPAVQQLAGYILSGPALEVHPDLLPPPPAIALLRVLAAAFPKCAARCLLTGLAADHARD